MELIIDLTHDVLKYSKIDKKGTLRSGNLFGYRDFTITEYFDRFEVDFLDEDNKCYTYVCEFEFADHGSRLVVTI